MSNHALLLNVKKQGYRYECYLTSVTSKTKSVALINGINADLMELRYIPKVIYKYSFTREQFLDLFHLEHTNSIEFDLKIRLWDSGVILNDWSNIIQINECHYIDLDTIKNTGKLSDTNWDIDFMKSIIRNEEL